jgi:TetR/AcrR family transcriptional repressor of mexJK operon
MNAANVANKTQPLSDRGPSPRGRRAADTSQRILFAATELFLRDGYAKTNLDEVASEAGVTKPTIYSHFGSKKGLLQAVATANAGQPVKELLASLKSTGDPQVDLRRFGDTFLVTVFSKKARLWDRLAAAEAHDHPELGEAVFGSGPARVSGALADYLKAEKQAGRLSINNPQRAAEQLIGLLLGLDLLRAQVGQPLPNAARKKRRCREAVAVFLAAYGVQT